MWTEIPKLSWSKSFCFDAFYFSLFVLEMQCCKTKQFQGFFLVFFDYSSQKNQACKWSFRHFFSNRNADQEQQEKKNSLRFSYSNQTSCSTTLSGISNTDRRCCIYTTRIKKKHCTKFCALTDINSISPKGENYTASHCVSGISNAKPSHTFPCSTQAWFRVWLLPSFESKCSPNIHALQVKSQVSPLHTGQDIPWVEWFSTPQPTHSILGKPKYLRKYYLSIWKYFWQFCSDGQDRLLPVPREGDGPVITAEYSQFIIKHLLYHNCADLNSHVIG